MAETKKTSEKSFVEAVGRRKTSVARVRVSKATKASLTVNDQNYKDYFPTKEMQLILENALKLEEKVPTLLVTVKVKGGGIHSQAEAVSHGLARACSKLDSDLRPVFKKAKLLTRDSRMKERRKFGLKKARKSPQWSKR